MFPRTRIHVSSSHLTYSFTIFLFLFTFFFIALLLNLINNSNPLVKQRYIPMVQFNRGDVTKDEVLESARQALQKLAKYQNSSDNERKDPKAIFDSVLQTMNKKEKRQFLALGAFNIYELDDFESLMDLGYEMNKQSNFSSLPMDYINNHKIVENNITPNYENLCLKTAFTLSNPKRPLDVNFCQRLKFLESEIKEGRELPLLTIYTWWPDPITDPEVLSKRAVMANWDLFRPFIVPVVFTNFRMNMAVANAHGWPCLPVEYENEAQQPIFKHTAIAMEKTFKSTFYGYAMANSMFDASLLLTLLSIKDRFVQDLLPAPKVNYTNSPHGEESDSNIPLENPIIISGTPISTAAVGLEAFEKMEYFHRHVENDIHRDKNNKISLNSNYVIYRGVDFTNDAPVVIDDDFLIPYLVKRRMSHRSVIIDTSETILCAKTHRHRNVNEWGRKYIQTTPRVKIYNKRYFESLDLTEKGAIKNTKTKSLMTVYDDNNRVRVMSTNNPL